MAKVKKNQDFLSEVIEESTEIDPTFPVLVAAAERRRKLLRQLVNKREQAGLSQTQVAARMGTSQSAIARLEAQSDAKESMIDRYAAAVGVTVDRVIVDRELAPA